VQSSKQKEEEEKMSYQERRTVVNILSGIAIVVAYCVYAFGRYQAGLVAAGDLKFWAGTMLMFIGVGIVAMIIIQIVFHILMSIGIAVSKKIQNEDFDDKQIEKTIALEMVEDEMGKLIELKSIRIGFAVAGVGFVGALVALFFGYSPVVMLNVMYLSFSVGSIFEGLTQLYFFRKGI
jgi:hypothetical protein